MAISAESEEMRQTSAAPSQVAATSNPTGQYSAMQTPRKVATPLPPLKPSQTGNRWPSTAPRPARISAPGGNRIRAAIDRRRAFGAVAEQGRGRRPFLAGAQHIGGADIARADLAHIARARRPR